MKMTSGVEWALHCCFDLGCLATEDRPVPAAHLAAFHDLPPAYLNKQLQALARDGIISSTAGKHGGFRLARRAEQVTLMDVVSAIEGRDPAFHCAEIRRQGPGRRVGPVAPGRPCVFTQAMRRAELAWRTELASVTLADIARELEEKSPGIAARTREWFAAIN